jgi:hypothetical protein
MIRVLINRSRKRRRQAYVLMITAIIILCYGFALITIALGDLNTSSITTTILNMSSILIFSIFTFFIAQILLKLYKYNMVIADFYQAWADALILKSGHHVATFAEFEALVKILIPEKINLETPDTPDLKATFEKFMR